MKTTITDLELLPPWEWPADAREIILETLRGQGPESERITAAHLAGDLIVMNDEVASNLIAIATNTFEPEELRATAAIAFGAVLESTDIKDGEDDPDDPPEINWELRDRVQDTLQAIQADPRAPKELRRRSLEASIRAPRDWHPQAIRAAFASPDEEWNLTAIFCTRWIRHLFKPEILKMLDSANEEIRREAVYAAGTNELEEAWPTIADLLESPDTEKDLLLTAIESASNFRTEESRFALAELLDSDDEDIVDAAHEALAMLGPEDDDDYDFEDEDEEETKNGPPS